MEYLFTFDDTFEIHDDIEVLKRMGMALGLHKANCSEENLAKVHIFHVNNSTWCLVILDFLAFWNLLIGNYLQNHSIGLKFKMLQSRF